MNKVTRYFAWAFLAMGLMQAAAHAATVILDWNAVTTNSDGSAISDLSGYTIYRATTSFQRSGVYISTVQANADTSITKTSVNAPATTLTVNNLSNGQTYFFRMTAYDTNGNQSGFNLDNSGFNVQISTTIPSPSAACDLNASGGTDVIDVQLEVLQALAVNSCTSDINSDGFCNVIDVQRVVVAALGGSCVVGP